MDILYLVGPHSTNGHKDLRYSLRSIDKYGKNIDRIFVCGHCPEFLKNIIKIECIPDQNLPKTKKIFLQLLYAVEHTDIGINHDGEFLISMDDHFYVKETDFNNYPFFVKDYIHRSCRYILPNQLDYTKMSVDYQQILVNTYHFCINNGLNVLNFAPHRNMHMNRYVFDEIKQTTILDNYFNNSQEIEGLITIQNYRLRTHPFTYLLCIDFKNDNPDEILRYIEKDAQCHCFSTNDFEINSNLDMFLNTLFPDKCKYETEYETEYENNITSFIPIVNDNINS